MKSHCDNHFIMKYFKRNLKIVLVICNNFYTLDHGPQLMLFAEIFFYTCSLGP